MKFIRVLLNATLTALFFSLLLSLLIADLNINLKPNLEFYARLTLFLFPLYGLVIILFSFIFYYMIEFLFGRFSHLRLISPSFLSLSFSFSLLLFLLLLRLNYSFYLSFFTPFTLRLIHLQMFFGFIIALAGLAAFWRYHRYLRRAKYFVIYFCLLIIGLTGMFGLRRHFPQLAPPARITLLESLPAQRKVTLLGLEGTSFELLIPLIQQGKLPNFSWLLENGSWGRLQTLSPTDPFLLKESLFTGKNPSGHRALSPVGFKIWGKEPLLEALPRFMLFKQLTRVKLLHPEPIPPRERSRSVWEILPAMNLKINIFNWLTEKEKEEIVFSPRAEKIWLNFFPEPNLSDSRVQLVRQALGRDTMVEEKAFQEKIQRQPHVFCLFLEGLNQVSIYFYKYAFPHLFGNLDHEEITRYGLIIEKYYQFYDQVLGKYLANLKDDEILVVFSTHGIEPLPLWKRLVEWILGNPQVSGHYEFAPPGVIFFYGQGINRGYSLEKIRLIDLTPTLLYILGLPVARNMDGLVCSSIFRPEFSEENPIFYISSYDEVKIKTSSR